MKGDSSQFEKLLEIFAMQGTSNLGIADLNKLRLRLLESNILSRMLIFMKVLHANGEDITKKHVKELVMSKAVSQVICTKDLAQFMANNSSLEDIFLFDTNCHLLMEAQISALTGEREFDVPNVKTDPISIIIHYENWIKRASHDFREDE